MREGEKGGKKEGLGKGYERRRKGRKGGDRGDV